MPNKKKKTKKPMERTLSPDKYIKENARKLKIGTCYANTDWDMCGMAMVIVTRMHNNGNVTAGFYKVDTFCLGVKDSFYLFNATEEELDERLDFIEQNFDLEEITYGEAHNIIYEAIEFAAEAGIKPCKEWALTRFILEEDDDNVPMITYEMGRNGKHFLIAMDNIELTKYLPTLRANLGDDVGYSLIDDLDDNDDWDDGDELDEISDEDMERIMSKTSNGEPIETEEYTHKTTVLADKPHLKQEGLWLLLKLQGNMETVLKQILDLPRGDLKDDLEKVLLYSMGKKYAEEMAEGDPTVFNAVRLLGEVGDERSLDILQETMRQDKEYQSSCFMSHGEKCYIPTLTKLAHCHTDKLEALLREPGITAIGRYFAMMALTQIYYTHPETQGEIKDMWHRLMDYYIEALPSCRGCDSFTAAFAVCALTELKTKDMLPQIKRMMDTSPVATFVCGEYDIVVKNMDDDTFEYDPEDYPADIREFYKMCKDRLWQES